MKKLVFILIAFVISVFAVAQENTLKLPELVFETNIHNFDTIEFEKPVTYIFKFKNNGKANLLVKNVIADCHCAVPEWSKTPYKKRKKGFIKITYNAGTKGQFFKTLIVQTNGKTANQSLTIKGFVR